MQESFNGTSAPSPIANSGGVTLTGFCPGQRVHATGDPSRIGTVRYVGLVEGYPGEWVGVDWDSSEGKHDGALNGVRYFQAAGVRSASFARTKNLSHGITFLEALAMRYKGDYTKEEEDEMYVYSTNKKRVSIQLVGKDKVQEKLRHFHELISVSVSYMGVSSFGDLHEVASVVSNLKQIDLTGNLLSKWQDVGSLCEALPALEVLNLTNNHLNSVIEILRPFQNIRILVLNYCRISWKEVEIFKLALPSIEELHLMGNNLKTLEADPSRSMVVGFDSLKLLNLEDNNISSWDEVLKLSQLKSLEQLYLNKNKLKHVYYPASIRWFESSDYTNDYGSEDKHRPFEKLCCLLLGGNDIGDVNSVDSLNSFPSLMDIRLSENPVADPAKGGIPRYMLVARLAKAEILNGSQINPRERKESEIRYVHYVMSKAGSSDPIEMKKLHPRFYELQKFHGIDDEKPSVGMTGPQKMAAGLISVTLKCVGASMGEKQPLTKKLPPTTTVGKLKVLCESFFKLKSIKIKLFLQEEGCPLPTLLDDEMATVADVGSGVGITFLVDEE